MSSQFEQKIEMFVEENNEVNDDVVLRIPQSVYKMLKENKAPEMSVEEFCALILSKEFDKDEIIASLKSMVDISLETMAVCQSLYLEVIAIKQLNKKNSRNLKTFVESQKKEHDEQKQT